MKVLITGGYGFIGSHVAERFHKEGYEIYIIDNLSTGKVENIPIKHKSYRLSVEDEKCEEIFRAYQFDVVVHLAAQVSVQKSMVNPQLDTESNILGIVNMLDYSAKYGVKKFIYASSAAVYSSNQPLPLTEESLCNPISPYGLSKWSNEVYSEKWNSIYGLSTLGFRFSNVYGPRQGKEGEGNVVSVFMRNLLHNQPLKVFGDGNQTRDFIYVEDVVDAIYRSVGTEITGIYNLSSNQTTSVNELVHYFRSYQPELAVEHEQVREGDIQHSLLDNGKIMKFLDWAPMYSLEQGLERTHDYFSNEHAISRSATAMSTKANKKNSSKYIVKLLLPTVENLLAFLLTAWLTLNVMDSAYGVIDVKVFYIIIIGILYGNKQALLSLVLSIGLHTYQKLIDGRDFISLTYDTDFFFQIAIYIFIGLVVGYTIERKNAKIIQQEQKISEVSERYEFLDHVYNEVREVKDELQIRILNSGDSYGKIYHATKELESLEPELVFNSAVNVVKSIMKVEKVSIYRVSKLQNYLRLLASSGYTPDQLSKSVEVNKYPQFQKLLQDGAMFVNKNIEIGVPLMMAPIFHRDRIVAIISIDGMKFESFSLYHQNLFQITVNLIASALSKAFTFIEATEALRFVSGTNVLQYGVFNEILLSKRDILQQHQVPFLLLNSQLSNITLEDASRFISPLLRETDYIGLNVANELQVLLSNANEDDADKIVQRLSHPAITFTVVHKE